MSSNKSSCLGPLQAQPSSTPQVMNRRTSTSFHAQSVAAEVGARKRKSGFRDAPIRRRLTTLSLRRAGPSWQRFQCSISRSTSRNMGEQELQSDWEWRRGARARSSRSGENPACRTGRKLTRRDSPCSGLQEGGVGAPGVARVDLFFRQGRPIDAKFVECTAQFIVNDVLRAAQPVVHILDSGKLLGEWR